MAIPEGFHTITPHIVVSDAKAAMALYEAAFGATSFGAMEIPNTGKVMIAMLKVGSSPLFLSDAIEGQTKPAPADKRSGASFYLYVEDVDGAHARAVAAGMTEEMAPQDMFWGDRMSRVTDPFGHEWSIATKTREVSPEEMQKVVAEMADG